MLKKGPGRVIRQFPRERPCDSCDEYAKHADHRDVVYEYEYDESGDYHRHLVACPHPARGERGKPDDPEMKAILAKQPLFDGFPYLITRVVEAMRHIIVLPADRDEAALRRLAELQVRANRLETCLVLAPDRAIFYSADGEPSEPAAAPRGGVFVSGKLLPAEDFEKTVELVRRERRLEEFIEALRPTGYFVCRARTSKRKATPEEVESLDGAGPDGVPKGLERCPACGEYRGPCLAHGEAEGWVATVSCRCENHNLCARCWEPLADRRLNSHVFQGGSAWHVPAFEGFSHRCPAGAGRIQ
jgi:hypothetical protein